VTHLPPYRAEKRYARHEDFAEGIAAALAKVGDVSRIVAVQSAGYAYPSYAEGARHVLETLRRHGDAYLLDGRGEVVSEVGEDPTRVAFTNATGAVVLARRAGFRGLVVDIGGSTAGTTVVGEEVDPPAFADPRGWLDHRLRHGKLCWVGAESTPLEALTDEVRIGSRRYAVIPRGVPFRNVSLVLGLVPEARLQRLSFFGLLPARRMALRAIADAVNLDLEMASEDELLEVARQLADAARARLRRAFEAALATGSAETAMVFGIGAPLAAPVLAAMGLEVTLGAELVGAERAEIASAYGALVAARAG